jgi:hypothetical protein
MQGKHPPWTGGSRWFTQQIPSPLRNPRVRGGVSNYPPLEYRLCHMKPVPITPTITVYEDTFNIIGTSTSISCNKSFYIIILLLGPANVWRTCPKKAGGKISLAHGIRCCLILLLCCRTSDPILWIICVRICMHIHISDRVQSVNALPLLSNNTERKT